MTQAQHFSTDELDVHLDDVRQSPADGGSLDLIASRPEIGARVLPQDSSLSTETGMEGDNWSTRGQQQDPPREPNLDAQLTLMNRRAAQAVAGSQERWPLAGDQLYVDLDISVDNLPSGTKLKIGAAMVEVTDEPHPGCKKFVERFGMDAMLWVNSDTGKQLRLRGVNTRIVQSGKISVGDSITKA